MIPVSLVGAGPGDPELLTVRALRRLSAADVVLYDALVNPELLRLAPRARRVCVGKRAGRGGVAQSTINRLLRGSARRGQRVVRLKCGDPFVFGRGGEEAIALAASGVPVEIVPGVSAAIAAPALAGIPVTHRGTASGFVVISGHAEAAYRSAIDAIAPGSLTLVVLMGLTTRCQIARALIARGWRDGTPVAILRDASRRGATTWIGRLRDLATDSPGEEIGHAPGTIVVGAVVDLAASIGRHSQNDGDNLDVDGAA